MSEWQREMVMNAIKYVRFVFILDTLADYTTMAEHLGVTYAFVSQAFEGREGEVAVGSSGAQVVIIPDVFERDSTSRIIDKIKSP